VSVYEYTVVQKDREDSVEIGKVRAKNKKEAEAKLRNVDLYKPKLKEIKGVAGFIKQFTADVK
jgi:type II secretory pathway component PulF